MDVAIYTFCSCSQNSTCPNNAVHLLNTVITKTNIELAKNSRLSAYLRTYIRSYLPASQLSTSSMAPDFSCNKNNHHPHKYFSVFLSMIFCCKRQLLSRIGHSNVDYFTIAD